MADKRERESASPRRYVNEHLAYTWALSEGWEWVDVDPAEIGASEVGGDVVFARPTGDDGFLVALLVMDYPTTVQGRRMETQERYLQSLRAGLSRRAETWRLSAESDGPYRFKGNQGWRMDGATNRARERFSVRAFANGRRQFILWCEYRNAEQAEGCDDAFNGVSIAQQAPETEGSYSLEEGLVLDDPTVPFRYQPPGTGWAGRGPILSMEGRNRMWQWVHREFPLVEVSFGPIADAHSELSSHDLAQALGRGFKQSCSSVQLLETTLGGKAATRLVLDGCQHPTQDMIVLNTPQGIYAMLITSKGERDETFIKRAMEGFEFR